MKKLIPVCLALGIMLVSSGCASVATNRYLQAQNPVRIRATENGAMIALDLFDMQTVKEHPFLTLGAAAVDGLTFYGVYQLGDKNDWWGNDDNAVAKVSKSPDQQTAIGSNFDVSGDGNTIIFYAPAPAPSPASEGEGAL